MCPGAGSDVGCENEEGGGFTSREGLGMAVDGSTAHRGTTIHGNSTTTVNSRSCQQRRQTRDAMGA